MTPREPRGFRNWDVPIGVLYLRKEADGRWIILAADPAIKIDNDHTDRIPHVHVDGWTGDDRRDLRPTLDPEEAARTIRSHLSEQGFIDLDRLLEELR